MPSSGEISFIGSRNQLLYPISLSAGWIGNHGMYHRKRKLERIPPKREDYDVDTMCEEKA